MRLSRRLPWLPALCAAALLLCLTLPVYAADAPKRTQDVIYGRKSGVALTMDAHLRGMKANPKWL
jgi:hypothetical protein